MLKTFLYLLLILNAFLFSSCVRQLGSDLGEGLGSGLSQSGIDSVAADISAKAVQGALMVVLHDSTQTQIRSRLDSLLHQFDKNLNNTAVGLRDSLLGQYTQLWIQQRLEQAGSSLQSSASAIRNDLLGNKTQLLIAALRNELLGDTTLQKIALIRNELLGENTRNLLDSLIQSSVKVLADNYERELSPKVEETLANADLRANKTINNLKSLTWILGAVIAALMLLAGRIYVKAKRHKKTLKILTGEIDKIPDQKVYDRLVGSIKSHSEVQGLAPHLQAILKEENLYQQAEWKEKDLQVLRLMGDYFKRLQKEEKDKKALDELKKEAEKLKLKEHLESILARSKT